MHVITILISGMIDIHDVTVWEIQNFLIVDLTFSQVFLKTFLTRKYYTEKKHIR